jgi:ATP-dependent exoDNAse (exonuclease V) beta subunit
VTAAGPLKHVFLLASAGSGKTWQLTSRYLRLLAADAEPASILASTFTRAAAGEIRDRVLVRLAQAATDDKKLAELADALGAPALTREQVLSLLDGVAGELHHMQIRTLDSFFASVVTAFALELGLPLGAGLVEDDEAVRMRSDAVRATLESGRIDDMVELLRQLTEGDAERAVTATIDETVRGLLALYQEAEAKAWECVPNARGRLDQEALAEAVEALEQVQVAETPKRLRNAWLESLRQIGTGDWGDLLRKGPPANIVRGHNTYYTKPIDEDLVNAYEPLVGHARAVLVQRARAQTLATRDLLERFERHYQDVKRRRRAMTFDDLSLAVKRAESFGRLEEICFRIDATLRHLLLDEFQDTSLPQWRALEPMAREIVSNAPGAYSFFCVGDVKQSLYGWRDAAPEVLDELPNLLVDAGGNSALVPGTLAKSWRSSQVVIDVVNRVFEHLDGNQALDDVRAAAEVRAAPERAPRRRSREAGRGAAPGRSRTGQGAAWSPRGPRDRRAHAHEPGRGPPALRARARPGWVARQRPGGRRAHRRPGRQCRVRPAAAGGPPRRHGGGLQRRGRPARRRGRPFRCRRGLGPRARGPPGAAATARRRLRRHDLGLDCQAHAFRRRPRRSSAARAGRAGRPL